MSWDIQNLFRKHAKEISGYLRRRGLTRETADDIAQETFVRILSSIPGEAKGKHNPKAYLFQISRNLSIDYQRRERLLPKIELSDVDLARIADPAPSPETILYDRQRLFKVEAALSELPDHMRRAFELHRVGELPIAKVAAQLGMSTTRTRTLIRDAYVHIEDRLNGL